MTKDPLVLLATAALVTAGCFANQSRKGVPERSELGHHTGRVVECRVSWGGRSGSSWMHLTIEDLGRRLSHAGDRPHFGELRESLAVGQTVRVAYDGRPGIDSEILYGLERSGEVLLAEDEVRAWARSNHRWLLVVAVFLAAMSGLLYWLSIGPLRMPERRVRWIRWIER